MIVAVIPARGGSKRIPRKNIRDFCGKPMIAWSIETAKASALFDRIIVSTDDDEIAAVAQHHGAEVPFRRPAELADDHAPTVPVIAHALMQIGIRDSADKACCIYPTAPLLQAEDLIRGYRRLNEGGLDYVFGVTHFPYPIQRAFRLRDDGLVEMFHRENYGARSQDLVPAYHDAGQFYWGTSEAWLSEKQLFLSQATGVVLPRSRVQDIDNPEDWAFAEILMRGTIAGAADVSVDIRH